MKKLTGSTILLFLILVAFTIGAKWSTYGDFGTSTEVTDSLMIMDSSDISLGAAGTQKQWYMDDFLTWLRAQTLSMDVLDDSDIASDNISAAQASRGVMITNDGKGGASDYNLPAGVKGMVVFVYAEEAEDIVLDMADADDIIVMIDGTALHGGDSIMSAGDAGNSVKIVCVTGDGGTAVSYWHIISQVGVWTDNGA